MSQSWREMLAGILCSAMFCLSLPLESLAQNPPGNPNNSGDSNDQNQDEEDPVNTRNGEFILREASDIDLGGGLRVDFRRGYGAFIKSEGRITSRLGFNWQHNFEVSVNTSFVGFAIVTLDRSQIIDFKDDGGSWKLIANITTPFQLVDTGTEFRFLDPRSNLIYIFDDEGRLAVRTDGRGNSNVLSYSTGGLLTNVTDKCGRELDFFYDADTLLTNVTDGDRSVSFEYSDTNLVRVINPLGYTTTYSYVVDAFYGGLMTGKTYPEGNTPFTRTYDLVSGRVTRQVDAFANTTRFDYIVGSTTDITRVTDPDGNSIDFEYNFDSELELLRLADGSIVNVEQGTNLSGGIDPVTAVEDQFSERTELQYDDRHGGVIQRTEPGPRVTAFVYTNRIVDGFELFTLSEVTHPDGSVVRGRIDEFGNGVFYENSAGERIHYAYTDKGNLLVRSNEQGGAVSYTYDPQGRLKTYTDTDRGTFAYHYDTLGRLTNIVWPSDDSASYAYDATDRLVAHKDPRGFVTTYEYDHNGKLTRVTDPLSNITRYEYDAMNRRVRRIDRVGNTNSTLYDARGLISSRTDRAGATTSFGYDKRRLETGIFRPLSRNTGQIYDGRGQLTGVTNANGEFTEYRYNYDGALTNIIDALGRNLKILRDDNNRVTTIIDPLNRSIDLAYNPAGLVASISRGPGATVYFGHNEIGRVTSMTNARGNAWTFGYTPMGRINEAVDPVSRTNRYEYDTRGRLSRIVAPDGLVISNVYDAANNVTRKSYSDGTTFDYVYDPLDRVTNTTGISMQRDAVGRITNTVENKISFSYGRDQEGRLTKLGYDDGRFSVIYDYDAAGRLTGVRDTYAKGGAAIGYDAVDRITSITRSNGVTATFTYDAVGQIDRVHEVGPTGTIIDIRYDFDDFGKAELTDYVSIPLDPSILMSSNFLDVLTHDAAEQIAASGYLYDSYARATNIPGATLSWKAASLLDRLTPTAAPGNAVEYVYNGYGDLMLRIQNDVTNRYFHDPTPVIRPMLAERNDNTGEFSRYYVYLRDDSIPDIYLLYGIDALTTNEFYYHYNGHNASTIALTDEAGAVTDAYAYFPYGRLLTRTGSNPQPFLYSAQYAIRYEDAGNLYDMRLRYYDPATGRFLSHDSSWPIIGNPDYLNPYQYAMADPINCVDPGGDFTLIELMIVIAIIAIIAAIAIPNLLDARKSGNETSAIGTLRAVNNAQGLFQQRDSDKNSTADYASTLLLLQKYELVDDVVSSGTKSGYYFTLGAASRRYSFEVTADPAEPSSTGDRYFKITQDGVIKFKNDSTEDWKAIE